MCEHESNTQPGVSLGSRQEKIQRLSVVYIVFSHPDPEIIKTSVQESKGTRGDEVKDAVETDLPQLRKRERREGCSLKALSQQLSTLCLWKSTSVELELHIPSCRQEKDEMAQDIYIVYDESKRKSKGGESPPTEISPWRKELLQASAGRERGFRSAAEETRTQLNAADEGRALDGHVKTGGWRPAADDSLSSSVQSDITALRKSPVFYRLALREYRFITRSLRYKQEQRKDHVKETGKVESMLLLLGGRAEPDSDGCVPSGEEPDQLVDL
ncbi:unnamed protein product [Pleuronectes platessa]|uniref:Uncharacterized protein n=1 Tax=Pleuronectes platessa TaxID=8262 RepID=A0A9N7YLQ2_PLEPL|nr:unnamed protein product [Pleuronectes platessa]